MSKQTQRPKVVKKNKSKKKLTAKPKDLYTIYNQEVDRYFSDVKQTTATYLQSITNLQQDVISSWKNAINSAIILQQKFGTNFLDKPKESMATKLMTNIAGQTKRMQDLQNQMLLASIDAIRNNIKTFGKNAKTIDELNTKLVRSYALTGAVPSINAEIFKEAISGFKKAIDDTKKIQNSWLAEYQ